MNKKLIVIVILSVFFSIFISSKIIAQDEKAIEAAKAIKAIDWNELAKYLPEGIEGFTRSDIDGGTINMTDPMNPSQKISYSAVECDYYNEAEDKEIKITITDSGLNQFLLSPYLMAIEFDGPDGGVKSIEVNGQTAKLFTEKNDGKIEEVKLMAVAGDRIIVVVGGDENCSYDEVLAIANKINLKELSSLIK